MNTSNCSMETLKNEIILDINRLNEEKHSYLKEAFHFPDYYGNNLDAFYDCVTEIDYAFIDIQNRENANSFSDKVLRILEDIGYEYANLTFHYHNENKDTE